MGKRLPAVVYKHVVTWKWSNTQMYQDSCYHRSELKKCLKLFLVPGAVRLCGRHGNNVIHMVPGFISMRATISKFEEWRKVSQDICCFYCCVSDVSDWIHYSYKLSFTQLLPLFVSYGYTDLLYIWPFLCIAYGLFTVKNIVYKQVSTHRLLVLQRYMFLQS